MPSPPVELITTSGDLFLLSSWHQRCGTTLSFRTERRSEEVSLRITRAVPAQICWVRSRCLPLSFLLLSSKRTSTLRNNRAKAEKRKEKKERKSTCITNASQLKPRCIIVVSNSLFLLSPKQRCGKALSLQTPRRTEKKSLRISNAVQQLKTCWVS